MEVSALALQGCPDLPSALAAMEPEALLSLGIDSLWVFIQENSTGPPRGLAADCSEELSRDGEDLVSNLKGTWFLHLASLVFTVTPSQQFFEVLRPLPSALLWQARYAFLHQNCLTHAVPSLKNVCLQNYRELLSGASPAECVEASHCFLYYYKYAEAEAALKQAQTATGLSSALTGKLGLKGKYQTIKAPVLVLEAHSQTYQDVDEQPHPEAVSLDEDSLLLETPTLDEAQPFSLTVIDQATLLGFVNMVNKTAPDDDARRETVRAYLDTIQQKSQDWLVYSAGLLLKSLNDSKSYKTK